MARHPHSRSRGKTTDEAARVANDRVRCRPRPGRPRASLFVDRSAPGRSSAAARPAAASAAAGRRGDRRPPAGRAHHPRDAEQPDRVLVPVRPGGRRRRLAHGAGLGERRPAGAKAELVGRPERSVGRLAAIGDRLLGPCPGYLRGARTTWSTSWTLRVAMNSPLLFSDPVPRHKSGVRGGGGAGHRARGRPPLESFAAAPGGSRPERAPGRGRSRTSPCRSPP